MSVRNIARYFDAKIRQRGEEYFAIGRTSIRSWSNDGKIEVRVRGTRPYHVRIEFADRGAMRRLAVDCDCPYVTSNGDFCKHIWAAILAVEADGRLNNSGRPVEVDFLDVDRDEPDADGDDGVSEVVNALGIPLSSESWKDFASQAVARWRQHRPGTPARKPRPPSWKELVEQVSTLQFEYTPSRPPRMAIPELWYILEGHDDLSPETVAITLATRRIRRAAEADGLKLFSIRPAEIEHVADQRDRSVLRLLVGAVDVSSAPFYGRYGGDTRPAQSAWQIPLTAAEEILPRLFETARVTYRRTHDEPPVAVSWDAEPWDFAAGFEPDGKDHRFVGWFTRGEERVPLTEVGRVFHGEPVVFVRGSRVGIARTHGGAAWLRELRRVGPHRVRASERAALLAAMSKVGGLPRMEWPAEWNISHDRETPPQGQLRLTKKSKHYYPKQHFTYAVAEFRYGQRGVSAGQPGAWVFDASASRMIERNREAERRLYNRLFDLGVSLQSNAGELGLRDKDVPKLVATLLSEGWKVEGERGVFRRGGAISIQATSGIDWFELNGQIDFGGASASLPEVLAAARRGESFVQLGDGSLGMLPEEWLKRHGALIDMGRVENGKVRFSKTQLGLIDVLLAELPEATFDEALATARAKLKAFDGIRPAAAPQGFGGALREYQKEGLGWLRFVQEFGFGGCLADDMGLGKTIQVLSLLLDRKRRGSAGPSLAVVPKSVVFNWLRESERFAPDLQVFNYTGGDREQLAGKLKSGDLVVTTYGTLRKDIDLLRKHRFDYAILDEAQAIKNPTSQSAKASRLLQANHRLAMTGTPVENHLGDLWSLFEFLNPGMLGTVDAFRSGFDSGGNGDPAPQRTMLARMLRPFILRRTKEHVAPELPPRIEQTIECELSGPQAEIYRNLRDHYRASVLGRVDAVGMNQARMHVLEALLRLRQAACHPGLSDRSRGGENSAKLDTLIPMIEEIVAEGHKALIFSQFTTFLGLLRKRLDHAGLAYEYLDGKTRDRAARCDRFQRDAACPLFLISLKAGGVGLNLTAADYVFILDPWWNPAVEAQAIDRTHRIGQSKRVIAYRIIARDTVESKILQLQSSKRDLAAAVINQSNSVVRDLTRDDLSLLLS